MATSPGFGRFSSTNEFHPPQSGHFPSHLADEYPQLWHSKIVGTLGMFTLRAASTRESESGIVNYIILLTHEP
jgi:hypothetical protein